MNPKAMIIYPNTVPGFFVRRLNRFTAEVMIGGRLEKVHVKNTGRLKELLLPDARVTLQKSDNPNRKTAYDLISVYKAGLEWVNIDSLAPNALVKQYLDNMGYDLVKPEYTYGKSRFDFYMERGSEKFLTEVKGCTLAADRDGKVDSDPPNDSDPKNDSDLKNALDLKNGLDQKNDLDLNDDSAETVAAGGREKIGLFPDAPTERGVKHLNELAEAAKAGYHCSISFVIQMNGIRRVLPNDRTHPAFGEALARAVEAGVEIVYYQCRVKADRIEIVGAD